MTWIALTVLIGIVAVTLTVGVVAVVVRLANAHTMESPQGSYSSGARVIVVGLSVPLFLLALFVGAVVFLTVPSREVAVEAHSTPSTPATASIESSNLSVRVARVRGIDAHASLSHPRVDMKISIPSSESSSEESVRDVDDQPGESSVAGDEEAENSEPAAEASSEQSPPGQAVEETDAVADSKASNLSNPGRADKDIEDSTTMASTTSGVSERNLPDWVEQNSEQADGELLQTFSSSPRLTFEEAEADVRSKIEEQVLANWKARHDSGIDWEPSMEKVLPDEAIRDRHDEIAVFDMGTGQKTPMHILHWRVALTPKIEARIEQQWTDYIVNLRMVMLGCAVIFLTVCTSTASGFFQLRKRFEGRHTFVLAGIGLTIVTVAGGAALATVRFLM